MASLGEEAGRTLRTGGKDDVARSLHTWQMNLRENTWMLDSLFFKTSQSTMKDGPLSLCAGKVLGNLGECEMPWGGEPSQRDVDPCHP